MLILVPHLFARALALASPATSAAADPAMEAPTAVEPSESYEALIAEAEAQREAGAHARAATLYTRAYRARPEADRADDLGLFIVKNAIADYRLALARTPSTPEETEEHGVLLEQEAALLDDVIRARRLGDLPPFIVEAELEAEQRKAALDGASKRPSVSPKPVVGPPLAAEDHLAAARIYAAVYEAMDDATQDGTSGAYNVLRAVSSYCSAHASDRDEAHLLEARSLLARFTGKREAREVAVPASVYAARQQVDEALLEKTQCKLPRRRYARATEASGPRACSSTSHCRQGEVCNRHGWCEPKHTTIDPQRTKRSGLITTVIGGSGLVIGGALIGLGIGTFSFGAIGTGVLIEIVAIPTTIAGGIVAAVGARRVRQRQRYYELRNISPPSVSVGIPTRTFNLTWRF